MPIARDRIAFRQSLMRIEEIINDISWRINAKTNQLNVASRAHKPVLIASIFSEILNEKEYEYKNSLVNLKYEIYPTANSAYIQINPSTFKRMMSNLINNAFGACVKNANSVVKVSLGLHDNLVEISIYDNGVGMSEEVLQKILRNEMITTQGEGHGIGYGQIHETLQNNNGMLDIKSVVGSGTKITLIFPQIFIE
ncbi:MAG: ATP-binding protein [Burkholderiales bacterium]|nr:ATP-binding protein [Burkholderiales bacterium]